MPAKKQPTKKKASAAAADAAADAPAEVANTASTAFVAAKPQQTQKNNNNKKKKKRIRCKPAKPTVHRGLRPGSFERLLKMSSHLVFGTTLRLQGKYKDRMRFVVESIIILILRRAYRRRTENNGFRIMAQNITGAFLDWASLQMPEAIKEFAALRAVFSDTLYKPNTETRKLDEEVAEECEAIAKE